MTNVFLSILILLAFPVLKENSSSSFFTGNANFYYISKLDDGSIINVPYRMLNTTWSNQHNNFELIGKLAIEFQPKTNYSFLMNDPQDFLIDLREFYLTWFTNFGEIRLGKQIQSWGFVDENSPVDNSCAYDYNFLFETGTERKIATNSLSVDMFHDNLKFGFTTTPFHQINRLPSDKAEFPIDIPITPKDYQFMDINNVNEFGAYLQLSTDLVDMGISYFSGYDRVFNLSGINVSEQILNSEPWPELDTVFTYRKTEVLGLGGVTTLSMLTLRADIGFFSTQDLNNNIEREYPIEGLEEIFKDELYLTAPIKEKAEYYQMTLQLEYQLPYNSDILIQYFKHDTLKYSAISPLDQDIDIPGMEADEFIPYNYFFPGMGSPLALMTHNALLIGLEKSFYNDRLSLQFRNLKDLDYRGYFIELNTEYKLSEKIRSSFAINYINGDQDHPNSFSNQDDNYNEALDYALNQMEDFSHFRMQITYSF